MAWLYIELVLTNRPYNQIICLIYICEEYECNGDFTCIVNWYVKAFIVIIPEIDYFTRILPMPKYESNIHYLLVWFRTMSVDLTRNFQSIVLGMETVSITWELKW